MPTHFRTYFFYSNRIKDKNKIKTKPNVDIQYLCIIQLWHYSTYSTDTQSQNHNKIQYEESLAST